ncbi:MAG: hypothetical protein ABSH14_02025, partial [Verrucomicrobiia bacterium]
ICSVFVEPNAPPQISMLLMVIEEPPDEDKESTVTVLLVLLLMMFAVSPFDETPDDQLPAVSHLPEALFIQILVVSSANAACEKSMVPANTTNFAIALECDLKHMVTYPK